MRRSCRCARQYPVWMGDVAAVRRLGARTVPPLVHRAPHKFHEPHSSVGIRRGTELRVGNERRGHTEHDDATSAGSIINSLRSDGRTRLRSQPHVDLRQQRRHTRYVGTSRQIEHGCVGIDHR